MADSGSLRVRRYRLHSRGDHSLCRRCEALHAPAAAATAGDASADPRVMLEGLAKRLEGAHKDNPADAAVARELRMTLQALRGPGGADDGELAGFLAEFGAA